METKYLIVLLIIPTLVVSLIFYIDKNPVATGAVITQQVENNVIGSYSIMPSFKAKVEYNLEEEYKNIKDKLDNLIENCKDRQDIQQCFKDKSNKLNWNCQESKEEDLDILYDFVDKFNECIALEEDGVVCRFSLDEREISKLIGIFVILLTNENQRIKVELWQGKNTWTEYLNLENLVYTGYNDRDSVGKNLNSVRIIIEYIDKKPVIKDVIGVGENSETIPLSKKFLLYKKDAYIKFVETPGSSFEAPQPANKIIDIPRAKGLKFCAKSQKQIYAYDKSDNMVKLRDIVYKFAVTFPKQNIPPNPIENLEVYDSLKAENSVVFIWDKSKEENIRSFSIYYSNKDFANVKTDDIKVDKNINKKFVKSDNPEKIEDINLNECTINPIGTLCKYSIYNKPLEKGRLYYWVSKNKYIYLLTPIDDERQYNFAVTAVNYDNMELNNDNSVKDNPYVFTLNKNYKNFMSKDDLPPNKVSELKAELIEGGKIKLTWKKPQTNIDGSSSIDTANFNIYFKKVSVQFPQFVQPEIIDSSYSKLSTITTLEGNCDIIRIACEYLIGNLEKNQIYNIAITAVDQYFNEFKESADIVRIASP